MNSFKTKLFMASVSVIAACGNTDAPPPETAGSGGVAGAAGSTGTGGASGDGGKAGTAGVGMTSDASRADAGDANAFDAGDPSARDTSPGIDANLVLDDASARCNDMLNVAPVIAGQKVAANIPSPRGGTMLDGTYYETAFTVYTGPGGAVGPEGVDHQLTAVIAGGMAHVAVLDMVVQRRYEFTITNSGTMSNWAFLCPGSSVVSYGYDASPTEIVLYITLVPEKLSTFTLTRQ